MEKKITVLGGIGNNDRKNRDGFRVLARGGVVLDYRHIYILNLHCW